MKGHAIAERDERAQTQQWYRVAGLGFEFVVAVLVMAGAGWLLDDWLGTSPWLLVAGSMFGFGVGLYIMILAGLRSFHD